MVLSLPAATAWHPCSARRQTPSWVAPPSTYPRGSILIPPVQMCSIYSQNLLIKICTYELTITCLLRPPFRGPIFNFYNIKLPLDNDHLSTTDTTFGSQRWSLYTGLTVHFINKNFLFFKWKWMFDRNYMVYCLNM